MRDIRDEFFIHGNEAYSSIRSVPKIKNYLNRKNSISKEDAISIGNIDNEQTKNPRLSKQIIRPFKPQLDQYGNIKDCPIKCV